MISRVAGLLGTVVLLAVVNGLLWVGQEMTHSGERQQLENIKGELDKDGKHIEQLEFKLKAMSHNMSQQQTRLKQLQLGFDRLKNSYPSGLPSDIYQQYSQQVDNYNLGITSYNQEVASYQLTKANYESAIASYNSKVEKANSLQQAVDRRIYLLPRSFR